jgi:hypothetical protein
MFRKTGGHIGSLGVKARNPIIVKRSIITRPTKTGSNNGSNLKQNSRNNNKNNESSSPFDSSFTFQLFLLVGAMGAGYTLGKTSILTSPPATLFPSGSTTSFDTLKDYEKDDKERENKQYDMFKRCALRILENKGINVDMKYGENESLFDEVFCSKDISQIMNDKDSMANVFFGKDSKEWNDKKFIWYPETTEDVSNILKNCDEFKVPINSKSSRIETSGLTFQIDFKNFKFNQIDDDNTNNEDKIELTFNMNNEEINKRLNKNKILLNNKLSALDLFFIGSGVKLSYSNNKLINNKFDINDINEIECVLPDGKILNVKNDVNDKDDYKLYNLLNRFQDDLCLITKAFINKKNNYNMTNEDAYDLVVIGSNDITKLNDIIKELKQKLSDEEISIIDNNGCNEISEKYGNYKTYAITKVENTILSKLNKKFSNNQESNDTIKIQRINLKEIYGLGANGSGYLTDKISSERAVIVKKNISDTVSHTFYVADPKDECGVVDQTSTNRDLLRRFKLAIDSNRILNRNANVAVQKPQE